jgi:chitin disaccharide deacetylase
MLLFLAFLPLFSLHAQQTLQERLGYPRNTKLLILHADDLGMCHSENAATIFAIEHGSVSSASIMMPTGWVSEIAAYSRSHPTADFGLHLTLTSEWDELKWGPVAGAAAVPGLVDAQGYFYSDGDSVYRSASLVEVEKELRAQIEKARSMGIDITHLDSHMGTLFGRPDYFRILVKLGHEYKLPVLASKQVFQLAFGMNTDTLLSATDVSIDRIFIANPPDFQKGMENYYSGILKSLQAGVSEVIFHLAYDNDELRAATINHPDYGAAWRQADFNFFSSETCRKILAEQQIRLITWREIRDKLLRH